MFYIIDQGGEARPYVEGAANLPRRVESVQGVAAAQALGGAPSQVAAKRELTHAPNPYRKLDQQPAPRQPAVLAEQIMSSPVVTIGLEQSLAEAFTLIRQRRFRHLPVQTRDRKLCGIISDRDLLAEKGELRTIGQVMKSAVLTARPDTRIRAIAQIMFVERIGCVPILDDRSVMVGIVTRGDILRTVVNQAPLELWT